TMAKVDPTAAWGLTRAIPMAVVSPGFGLPITRTSCTLCIEIVAKRIFSISFITHLRQVSPLLDRSTLAGAPDFSISTTTAGKTCSSRTATRYDIRPPQHAGKNRYCCATRVESSKILPVGGALTSGTNTLVAERLWVIWTTTEKWT